MTIEKTLSIFGATRANKAANKNLIVSIEGDGGCGKSRFWMTAPGPILVIDLDQRMDDTIQEFQKDKEIYVITPEIDRKALVQAKVEHGKAQAKAGKGLTSGGPTKMSAKNYKLIEEAWENVVEAMEGAAKAGVKTIAWDTGDEMLELLRLARFGGRLDKIQPMEYGPVNSEHEKVIRRVRQMGMNMIITHKMKAEYKGDKSTGKMVRAGYSKMNYLVDLALQLRYEPEKGDKEGEFFAKVMKCGTGPFWTGKEFRWNEELEIDEVQFPFIAAAVTSGEEDVEDARGVAAVEMEEWS